MQKIHPRIQAIILQLCKAANYIPLADIAQQIGVSAKTVTREMAQIEQVLHAHGFTTERKTGIGVRLVASSEKKNALASMIKSQVAESIYTPEERLTAIAGQLLQDQQPIKLFKLASQLHVGESTVSNDLDKLEGWFLNHSLNLVRKPGFGIHLEGSESNIRKAIVQYIYENISEQMLLGIFHDHFSNSTSDERMLAIRSSKRLLNLTEQSVIDKLEHVLRQTEAVMCYKLSDSAYIGLIVHLALGLERFKKAEKIEIAADFLAELKNKREYKIADIICAKVAEVFQVAMPEAETGYIAMHIIGSRNQYSEQNKNVNVIDNFQLVQLTRQMLKIAEQETGAQLMHNEKLMIDLVHHLGPSISRLKMHMEIRNPLLKEMQKEYPALMKVSKACAVVLESALGLALPEAEIAYIAMHIGAAIESNHKDDRKYTIAIACPTGMGTSKLLAANIKKEYPHLKIAATVSALQISEEKLRREKIDLLVSTVAIRIDFPIVVVNSLLLAKDKQLLDEALYNLKRSLPLSPATAKMNFTFAQRLQELNLYGECTLQLIRHFFIFDNIEADDSAELIDAIGRLLIPDTVRRAKITDALLKRESYGGTLLTGQNMILLHCRDEQINELHFGIARVHSAIYGINAYGENEQIKTAVIMLAPQDCPPQALETMGFLSGLLADTWNFTELFHEGEKELLQLQFNNKLQEFYKEKNKLLMEE